MILDHPDGLDLAIQAMRLDYGAELGYASDERLRTLQKTGDTRWLRDAATAELERRRRLS